MNAFTWFEDGRGGAYGFFGPFKIWIIPMQTKTKDGTTRYAADVCVPSSKFHIQYNAARFFETYAKTLEKAICALEKYLRESGNEGEIQIHHTVTHEDIQRAKQVLVDNGVEDDEAGVVLQAVGYTLLDTELDCE